MTTVGVLRAVNYRLVSTPVEDLPSIVGFLSTSIYSCTDVFKEPSIKNSETSVQVHKFKTRVSSLLQDRSQEGRFVGVVLAKAAVEIEGSEFLGECGTWTRNILSCLNKPDPTELKRLYLVTLARIFILTANQANLVREVTIPTLPAFISTCLTLIKPIATVPTQENLRVLSPLLLPTLQCWIQLMKRFPSTFRPHIAILRAVCMSLIGDMKCPEVIKSKASEVVATFHFCAPKNTVGTDWLQLSDKVIEAAHEVTDHIFRSVVEDWSLSSTRNSSLVGKNKTASEIFGPRDDTLGMGPWVGLTAGCSRLVSLINLLCSILTNCHAQIVSLPIVTILDLCGRIAAVTLPSIKFSLRTNPEITRNEREDLYLNLPRIHASILNLLQTLTETFQQTLMPVSTMIRSQVWEIFNAEQFHEKVRAATYRVVSSLLEHQLFHPSKTEVANVLQLISCCCADLKLELGTSPASSESGMNGISLSVQDQTAEQQPSPSRRKKHSPLYRSAWALLPAIFFRGSLNLVPSSSRALLDSTAILINHREAMLASVLNPPKHRSTSHTSKNAAPSILPFLAASDAQDPSVEALLRPRMPRVSDLRDHQNLTNPDEHGKEKEDTSMEVFDSAVEDASMQNSDLPSSSSISAQPTTAPQMQVSTPSDTNTTAAAASTSLKRDFASTLQQSTNPWIPDASPSSSSPTTHAENETKRIRTEGISENIHDTSFRSGPGEGSTPKLHIEDSLSFPAIPNNGDKDGMELPIQDALAYSVPDGSLANAPPGSSIIAGKAAMSNIDDADDDESDFEMPVIDTTLSTSDEEGDGNE